jgi:hypothetical protein
VHLRPADEWFVIEQPLLKDLLGDETLRELAIAGQHRHWQHLADPDRPKVSKSKHKASDYLLSGILYAKQDGRPLVGVLCGRVGKKTRYYRHRRGRTGYQKWSVFNKVINARNIENAVIDVVKETLLATENIREKLLNMIEEQSKSTTIVDVEELKRQRDAVKKRTEMIVAHLDEESLADAKVELEKLKAQRRQLDEQIASAVASTQSLPADANALVENIVQKVENFFSEIDTMPKHLLRDWLGILVPKVTVDMETKAIEIHVQLPSEMLKTAFSAEKSMRFVSSLGSSGDYETHPSFHVLLGIFDCMERRAVGRPCYECRRAA